MSKRLRSCLCTQEQLESPVFRRWARKLRQPFVLHRKLWEFCYIVQALHERGVLRPGSRGLGFGVGQERLPAPFASLGCQVVATDLGEEKARNAGWGSTNQHAASPQALANPGLCKPSVFAERVSFRPVDMSAIPPDLRGFDFTWSSCSLEHLGSIRKGQEFLSRMMDTLKPGGVAVHTTEFNLSSNASTLDDQPTVLFRRRDIEDLAAHLSTRGQRIRLDFSLGSRVADHYIDVPPYQHDPGPCRRARPNHVPRPGRRPRLARRLARPRAHARRADPRGRDPLAVGRLGASLIQMGPCWMARPGRNGRRSPWGCGTSTS